MYKLNITKVQSLLQAVAIDQHEPVMLWGQPGAGKSEAVQQLAVTNNAELVDIRASQFDSVDFRGIPVPTDTGHTVWYAPSVLPFIGNNTFPDDRMIILFLDEINSAAPSVAAVCYQLINDRRVGEHVLKPNVRVIAAGNRESDRGVTNRMPTPLANRFTHVEVEVDAETWIEWALDNGVHPIFTAFFKFRPALITTFDPSKPDKAFATPRTWAKAAKYYSSDMPRDVMDAAIAGAVGMGPGAEFMGFTAIWQDMPDLNALIKSPSTASLPDGVGMSYAVAVGLSGKMTLKNADAVHTYLDRMAPEYVVCAWTLAIKRDAALATTDAFVDKYAKKYINLYR
jgi:hypothetical protein